MNFAGKFCASLLYMYISYHSCSYFVDFCESMIYAILLFLSLLCFSHLLLIRQLRKSPFVPLIPVMSECSHTSVVMEPQDDGFATVL